MTVSKFRAPVIAIREVAAGSTIGYGSTFVTRDDVRIAVVAAGYADGYPREIGDEAVVAINGEQRRIVGRVSMDMITVQLLPTDSVTIGDPVELWGEHIPIEQVALQSNTIPYTLMCGVSSRVLRIYGEK